MKTVEVRVPGKIMLAGEYAVLRGGSAIASTVDAHLIVHAELRAKSNVRAATAEDAEFFVSSNLWQEPVRMGACKDDDVSADPLLTAVRDCQKRFGIAGGTLDVKSNLNVEFGVGSSAALRLGVFMAMDALINNRESAKATPYKWDLARYSYQLQKQHQGFASGYDLATQVLGGLVLIQPPLDDNHWPGSVAKFASLNESLKVRVFPFVGGHGAPTKVLVKDTLAWIEAQGLWDEILMMSEELVTTTVQFLLHPDDDERRKNLFRKIREHRKIFSQSPGYPKSLTDTLEALPDVNQTWSFKTSGAGGEDAMLLFGAEKDLQPAFYAMRELGWYPLPYAFSNSSAEIVKGART